MVNAKPLDDEATKAAKKIEMVEAEDGYSLDNTPEESITSQHATDVIPERDVTDEMLMNSGSNPRAWLMYGGGYKQQRYTTADVINKGNVDDLELEYLLQTGVAQSMEGTPIVVPGDPPIMYQTNGPNYAKALNARTGEVLWSYVYSNPSGLLLCCDNNNRGFAVYGDKVFMTTLDSGVVALDRYTGEEVWYKSTGDHKIGYSATWAPTVYKGQLITGSAGGEYGVRGFVQALNPDNGSSMWKRWTTPKEEWVGDTHKHGAATSWMTRTYNPRTDTMYSPIGNPGPDFDGSVRPGPNRYSVGTLSLDAMNGDVNWHLQESPHDVWDYDSISPRVVIQDQDVRGETRDIVVNAGKTGWVYTMDAESGQLLERSEPVTQHINMWSMIPRMQSERRVSFVPGAQGGNDWQPPSYNPQTGLMYVKMQNAPQEIFWTPAKYEAGKTYWGGALNDWPDLDKGVPDAWNGKTSVIAAVDPVSGSVEWREWIEDDNYLWGGSVTTKTGLTFMGTQKGNLVAYDAENGDRLWQKNLGAPICSSPMSWHDPGTGKQYVGVQVGGSGWLHGGRRGSTVAVFSLGR